MAVNSRLYDALRTTLQRALHELAPDRHRDILTFPPRSFDDATHALLANLERSGFCTLLVARPESWNPRAPYYEQVRQAARRGRSIERAFLLSHRHARHNPSLREHVRLDAEAGVQVRVLNIGDLLASERLPGTDRLEVGLWDDHLTCTPVRSRSASGQEFTEWRVSRRPEDSEYVRELQALLREAEVIDLGRSDDALHLEEPMISSAPLASRLAPVMCVGDHVDAEDCTWYHGIWQFLRVFDMVSTPTWHSAFYLENLRELARDGAASVLITGTADYSMYAHVVHGFRMEGREPQVTVIDLCETPLMLCRWYGRLAHNEPNVVRRDVLDFRSEAPFDAVVTDAFITRFASPGRARVGQAWARCLRAGGTLLTTVRIEPGLGANEPIVPSAAQVEAFRRRARRAAERWRAFLLVDPAEIEAAARTYAAKMVSNAFRGVEDAIEVLDAAGFNAEYELVDVAGELKETTYAEIIAVKR